MKGRMDPNISAYTMRTAIGAQQQPQVQQDFESQLQDMNLNDMQTVKSKVTFCVSMTNLHMCRWKLNTLKYRLRSVVNHST